MPSEPVTNPIDRSFYLEQQAKLTEQSVKQQEAGFVKGALKGVAASVPTGLAAIGELLGGSRAKGLTEAVQWYVQNKLVGDNPAPGEATGYDFGNVTGNFIDPFKPLAAVGGALGIGKAGLFVGIGRRPSPAVDEMFLQAREAFKRGETPAEIWKKYGIVNLNQGVKNAPPDLARHLDTSGISLDLAASNLMLQSDIPFLQAVKGIPKVLHPDEYRSLFDNYKIAFEKLPFGENGYHSPGDMRIVLNESLRDPQTGRLTEEGRNTLVHEMQHAVQLYEDFLGKGSNLHPNGPAAAAQAAMGAEAVAKLKKQAVDTADRIKTDLTKVLGPDVENYSRLQREYTDAASAQTAAFQNWRAVKNDPKATKQAIDDARELFNVAQAKATNTMKNLHEALDKLNTKVKAIAPTEQQIDILHRGGVALAEWLRKGSVYDVFTFVNLDKATNAFISEVELSSQVKYKFYKSDIGEVWARVAGKSADMTEAEMRTTFPWRLVDTPPSQQISRTPGIGAWEVK